MVLDTSSLIVATLVVAFVIMVAQMVAWRANHLGVSMLYWASANVFVCLALISFVFRASPFAIYAIFFSLFSLALTNLAYWAGVRLFTTRRPRLRISISVFLLYLAAMSYFLFADPSVVARASLLSAYLILVNLLTTVDLLWIRWTREELNRISVGILFGFHAAFYFGRFWYVALFGASEDLFISGTLQTLTFLEGMGFITAVGIGFIAMTTERLHNQLNHLATIDSLTGVHNRRALLEAVTREFERWRRGSKPFSLLLYDLDHFKTVNDTYGHLAGDAVLQAVAAKSVSCLRNIDVFGRYGGEEFGALLPETDAAQARNVAERLRQEISQLVVFHDGRRMTVTVSIGVAEVHDGQDHPDAVIAEADAALYTAKEGGRNRITISSGTLYKAAG